jgi:PAS domain S-box-containing protein
MKARLDKLKEIIDELDLDKEKKDRIQDLLKSSEKQMKKLVFQIDSYKENAKSSKILLNNIIQEIDEKNTRFQNTINNLQDVYFRTDMKGTLLQASPSICERFGYDHLNEVIGQNVGVVFYKNQKDRILFLEKITKDGRVINYGIEFINKKGLTINGELNCILWYNKDGSVGGIEGIVHDVTERVETERKLMHLNEELQNSLENIEEQKSKIETQNAILTKQTELVTYQQEQLTKSINYAQRIQKSILSDSKVLNNHFFDHFLFYQASSIISGDFYFFQEVGNYLVIAIADCTGHGVPGGFMTMLGITFIDEIIRRKDVNSPVTAMNLLREHIIRSLKQEVGSEVKDGLDLAMCAINLNTLEMEYAGANIPMYLLKNNNDFENDIFGQKEKIIIEDNLIEFKPDRIPIGFYYLDKPFSKYRVQLKRGDKIYITTDGFPDQFGGKRGRKYLTRNFKKIIHENHHENMNDQKQIFIKKHEDWKRDFDQVDDILVFGLTI